MKQFLNMVCLLAACLAAQAQPLIDQGKAMEYLQEQQYDRMISYLLPVANGNEPKDISLLAYAYYQSGRLADAARTYEHVLSIDSNAVAARQSLAGICMQQKQYNKALLHYQRLVQYRPENAFLWKQLSSAAYALGQADSGLAWLNRSYRLNPADEQVAEKLAEHWIAAKQYDLADALIYAYLQTDSQNVSLLQLAVKTAYMQKRYEHAAKIGAQLRGLEVVSPSVFSYVTAACYQLKRYQDCITIYEYLDQRKVSAEHITYYAALGCTGLKDFKRSNALLKDCIDMAKSDMLEVYYHCSAQNYESLQQYKPALACLDSSYYLSHQILRLYSMGRIYETGLSNTPAATKYYKRFLQLYRNGSADEKAIYDYLKDRMKRPEH